jgi:predicted metalloprotease with PDZ domain
MLARHLPYLKHVTLGILFMGIVSGIHSANANDGESKTDKPIDAVQYRLSFRQADSHRVDIELSVPTDGQAEIELMIPVWTPGSYLVREYARQIEQVTAVSGSTQRELVIQKKDKNHWTVGCRDESEVMVRYTLYCREMSVRTNWVEREFAFLTGAATFLTRSDMLDNPHVVRMDALPNWPNIATSLDQPDSKDLWLRSAADYDDLVDSPILLGNIDIQSFEVGGAKHHLATIGGESLWDTKIAVRDVAKIVEQEQAFWKETPYKEYWFLNLATEGAGGLEHNNNCVLMTGRWAQRQKAKYLDWLGLVSHEFFHTWNVRRLRPKVLQQYDYNQEQYLQELWVAEGVTSYYDDLIVARTGLFTPKEYLDRLSKNISAVQLAPGRLVQSLTDSSFDSWIKFYRPDENANNSRISYYLKGALVGMLLDVELRRRTQDEKSLDDLMRSLWEKHRDTGYTNEDVAAIAKELCGESLDDWLAKALKSSDELDYSKMLEWFGLEWKAREPDKNTTPDTPPFGNVYAGLELKADQGKSIVDKVARESPAAKAGIQSGDELISFDGFRVGTDTWSERLSLYRPNDSGSCLVARRGKIVELTLKLGAQPENSWTLVRIESPSEEQESHWRAWLGLPPAPDACAKDE